MFAKNEPLQKKSPLIVEADESLEWFEKEKYYLAKGNVILLKDGLKLLSIIPNIIPFYLDLMVDQVIGTEKIIIKN